MLDWHGSGMSVMEMSHRGKEFMGIAAQAEADLRELMAIPANYKVLFLQGGASAAVRDDPDQPAARQAVADYVHTGEWAKKAIKAAKMFCNVNVVASAEDKNFTYAPAQADWKLSRDAAYVHYTANETIGGVEFHWTPEHGRRTAGLRHVVQHPVQAGRRQQVRPDLRRRAEEHRPGRPDHRDRPRRPGRQGAARRRRRCSTTRPMVEAESMYNTPPTYAIYIAGLVFQWLKRNGGVAAMEKRNIEKANAAVRLPWHHRASTGTRCARRTSRA
jgi:phosphoserine aminotransferase